MLRACLSQMSRSVVSSSRSKCSSTFHTSSICKSGNRRSQRSGKKSNEATHKERARYAENNRPHVVLGIRPNDEAKWRNCDLAKILVTEQEITSQSAAQTQPSWQAGGILEMPKYLNFGVAEAEKKMLFEILPVLSAQGKSFNSKSPNGLTPTSWMMSEYAKEERKELDKANVFAKVLDLRNANARGIAYENRRRCVLAFSEPDNPFDPGRPEVQAALLTMKIRNLWAHLNKFKPDVGNRRSLRKLVHQRAKILKYLKRLDRDRYDNVLVRLGLETGSVEGELVV